MTSIDKIFKDNIFFICKIEGTSTTAIFTNNAFNDPSNSNFANSKDLLKKLIAFFYYISKEFVKRDKFRVNFTVHVYFRDYPDIEPVNITWFSVKYLDDEAEYLRSEHINEEEYEYNEHKSLLTQTEFRVGGNHTDKDYLKVFTEPFKIVITVPEWYDDRNKKGKRRRKTRGPRWPWIAHLIF